MRGLLEELPELSGNTTTTLGSELSQRDNQEGSSAFDPKNSRNIAEQYSYPVAIEPQYEAREIHLVPPFEIGPSQSMVRVRILGVAVSAERDARKV